MIKIDSSTRIPTPEETIQTLRFHNSIMPQFADFDKLMMTLSYLQLRINEVAPELYYYIGKPSGVSATENMKFWLNRNENTSGFDTTKTGISLDKDSIDKALESNTLSELGIKVIEIYQKYAKFTKMRSTLVSLLQNPLSDAPSCDGHKMLILRPEWSRQNTGRVAMSKPAVQNLHHELQELITVPEGYVLCHTDSGQIEPRIIYSAFIKDPQIQALIRLYNDAYFGVLHYITMPEFDIQSGRTNFTPNEITDDMKENRKKIKTYSNAVMYGSKSNASGDPIKSAMIKRIGGHPSRLAWVRDLSDQIKCGVTIFNTAFGTPIKITNSSKLSSNNLRAESIEEEMIKLAINNPIQGTAADLMRVSVYEANKVLANQSKKSYIINYVHDAGMFAIHQDEFDRLKDVLGDIVSYEVDNWLPILAEPEFGRDGGSHGLIPDYF